jgi:hypothetical protein
MNTMKLQHYLGALVAVTFMACGTPEPAGDGETSTSAGTDTSDATDTSETDTGTEEASRGLPEGMSTWSGQLEVNGVLFAAEASITNTGGDLQAAVTIMDHPDQPLGFGEAEYSLTGTHEPGSGLVALAPDAWIVDPPTPIELVGFDGSYDPDTQTLSGVVVDYASGLDNSLTGGPAILELVDGPGEPTVVGDEAASLANGSQTFTGQLQCTGPVREVEGQLVYDGQGSVSGSLTLGDPGLGTPLGTFAISGVHNPSTGGITLIPGLWDPDTNHNILTFFIDGTYDPDTGEFVGDQRTNTAVCPPGTWQTSIE